MMVTPAATATGDDRSAASKRRRNGQVLVIFAGATVVMILMMAIVIDLSWLWSNSLKIQRAADAAALAGAVTLPTDPNKGIQLATFEATKNGYTQGSGVTVTPTWDGTVNPNRMTVTIKAPVPMFFMRIVGLNSFDVTRTSRAEYNLPLKMGSPQSYYGVGQFNLPTVTTVGPVQNQGNTGFETTQDSITRDNFGRSLPDALTWDNPDNALNDENNNPRYATENTNGDSQVWQQFNLQGNGNIPAPGTTTNGNVTTIRTVQIDQVQVRLKDIHLTPTNNQTVMTNCQVKVEVWWGGGLLPQQARWLAPILVTLNSTTDQTFIVPSTPADVAAFAAVPWTYTDFDDQTFKVRLTWVEGQGCGSTGQGGVDRGVALDALQAQVAYTTSTTTKTTNPPTLQKLYAPDGTELVPQNFWGAMQSYGAPSIQGDAYMTGYQTRKSTVNPAYQPEEYYNYALEIPPGAGGGEVWIFDPEFCDTGISSNNKIQGAGDNWTIGSSYGVDPPRYVNAYYELFDMHQTPYDRGDDTLVATSGNQFTGQAMNQSDQFLGGSNQAANSCQGKPYHAQTSAETKDKWWRLAANLGPGLYRVHTASRILTDPAANQADATGMNAFAIWAKTASGPAPKVYGLGAMEAYFGMTKATSEFYLAQIEKQYAGKWMDIDLWDPGDTGALTADLQVLMPTSGGYVATQFYSNTTGSTTIPANFTCGPTTSSAQNSIRTSSGNGGYYDGQWLRLCLQVPTNYTAPKPSGEPFDGGWYKIRYNLTGDLNAQPSTDLTTWRVRIRDNPVHLVTP